MKKILVALSVLTSLGIQMSKAENNFDKWFCDSTLRIDYTFGGGPDGSGVFLMGQTKQKGWAGRQTRLKDSPLRGNGNILVKDPATGDTLYNNSFSTLFQEWLSTPEAKIMNQSFENSFLVPLPLQQAEILLELRDNKNQIIATHSHKYRPDDELVRKVKHPALPHKYLYGSPSNRKAIDLAILGEGYLPEEMESFLESAKTISDEIMKYEPFASNKDKFNIIAVMTPSDESGVSIPLKDEWKKTRYGSHYSTFYSGRYLTSPRVIKMHEDLEGIPYEYILMLVNTDEYGGGGIYNNYQIAAANNSLTLPVSVHEFGHSFGGLGDEYDYGDDDEEIYPSGIEPWEPNITTLVDFESKWAANVTPGIPIPTPWERRPIEENANLDVKTMAIGAYEGAGYRKKGIFRPSETCRMRDNYFPDFCKICEQAIQERINFYSE